MSKKPKIEEREGGLVEAEREAFALPVEVEIARETMLGDLMKLCIDELKAAPDVWPKLSQEKQEDVIERIERRVGTAVRAAVEIIAAQGRIAIAATLEQVTVKDGIKAVVTLSRSDARRHELIDACGQNLLLVVADATEHMGGASQVQADPQQRELPVLESLTATEKEALAKAGFVLSEEQLDGLTDTQFSELLGYAQGLEVEGAPVTAPAWLYEFGGEAEKAAA